MQGFQALLGCKLHIILHVNNILLVEHRIILHKSGLISDYFSHIVTEDRKYFFGSKIIISNAVYKHAFCG